jgi:hypothetical protein
LTLWPWPQCLTHFFENFNFGHIFWMVNDRALVFYMLVPCDNRDFSTLFCVKTSNKLLKIPNLFEMSWFFPNFTEPWTQIKKLWKNPGQDLNIGALNFEILTLGFDDEGHLWNLLRAGAFVFHNTKLFLLLTFQGCK